MSRPQKKLGDHARTKPAPAPSLKPWWQVLMPCSITLSSGKTKYSRIYKNIQGDSADEACDVAPRLLSNAQALVVPPKAWMRSTEAVLQARIAYQDSQWPK